MKSRLDMEMVERGLSSSRSMAQRVIMAGEVLVDGQLQLKPSFEINKTSTIALANRQRFVSRGGDKLEHALITFKRTELNGLICADVGASTGGFTDCLLHHGVKKIYAIDVGYGQLDWRLRQDERVVVMERTNARLVENLPDLIDLVVIDASFISLRSLFPSVKKWLKNPLGEVISLIKPQFEVGREAAAKGKGVIRDSDLHMQVLSEIMVFSQSLGLVPNQVTNSPLLGPKGNREFLMQFYLNNPIEISIEDELRRVVNSPLTVKKS